MKRRLFYCFLFSLAAVLVASFFEPFRIVPGLWHGDAFYYLRPARYWREVFRKDGETGQVREETLAVFATGSSAWIPVIQQCLNDPDPNVRWPAVSVLRRKTPDRQVVPIFCGALRDDDPEVRLTAIQGLLLSGMKFGKIPEATQKLVEVMKNDSEGQVRHVAETVLWRIDPQAAREARGWLHYVSKEWSFSVEVPEQPKRDEPVIQTSAGPVQAHGFQFWMQPSVFSVIVSEYPKEFVEATTEQQRNEELQGSLPFFFPDRNTISENQVEVQGHKGVETRFEVDSIGEFHERRFWVGRRFYAVMLIFKNEFIIPEAATYFLESFRFEPSS